MILGKGMAGKIRPAKRAAARDATARDATARELLPGRIRKRMERQGAQPAS